MLLYQVRRIPLLLVHDGVGPLFPCLFEDIEVGSEIVACSGFDVGVAQGAAEDGHVDAGCRGTWWSMSGAGSV